MKGILPFDYPDISLGIEGQQDLILLTMCVWAEARGEQTIAQLSVACTIRNRVIDPRPNWWGNTWREVILKPRQFSSFNADLPGTPLVNEEDPNRKKLLYPLAYGTPQEWIRCFYAALGVFEDYVEDLTCGANHYYDLSMKKPPKWAEGKEPVALSGQFRFFKL